MENNRYKTIDYKGIKVSYLDHLIGGGQGFGQEYIRVVREKVGPVDHLFEFCAGPGFIGFSLMAQGLCNKLTLADINPDAVKACQDTITKNNLQDRVSVYLSDCLDSIPETEQWDLVVGNPPHFWTASENIYIRDIRRFDPNMRIHKSFYQKINKFLKPNGSIIMQENGRGTKYEDFSEMIAENNLQTVEVFYARVMSLWECITKGGRIGYDTKQSQFYFIWTKKKGECSSCTTSPCQNYTTCIMNLPK